MNAPTLTALVFLAAGGLTLDVAAQEPTTAPTSPPVAILEGAIVDSITGQPIEGVMVQLDSGHRTFSDALGSFLFTDLPEGKRLVALLTADCRVTWSEVTVLQRFPRSVEFRLPPAFGAAAEEEQRQEEERMRGGGKRMTAEEIDKVHASNVIELIRRLAPSMVSGLAAEPGATSSLTSGRNYSFLEGEAPVVVIDGLRIPNPEEVLDDMRPSEVQLLEVMPGAAAGWEFGSSGSGGVIRISLRRGIVTGAPERRTAAECVVPGFPRR